MISADEVAKNNIDEPFRYECLCCGEEVHIAAVKSKKMGAHFRHLRGNSDKDCELYLGGLLQTGTGIESAVAIAQKRARARAEILFDVEQRLFYLAISFSEDKLSEYQSGECELEINTDSTHPMNPVLISQTNFAPDSPVRFPLRLSSNTCYISIHSRKNIEKAFNSRYELELLKSIEFPTFFKYQSNDVNESIVKRHTDGIIYTDTRYYALALQKSYIEKLFSYSPNISVGTIEKFATLGSTVYGAEILISEVSRELRDTMAYFGYYLRKAERITLLWPPSYEDDGVLRCKAGEIILTSSFELRPRSNISCNCNQLSSCGELYTIELTDLLRISQTNFILQISPEQSEIPIIKTNPTLEATHIVEVNGNNSFYYINKNGYRLLTPGRYHLTDGASIIQCIGNKPIAIYVQPEPHCMTPVKRLMDIRKYYNVSIPYHESLIADIQLSKVAEIYIEGCRNNGIINVKALEYIKAGKI
jgi:hypothetical protein